MMLRPFWRYYGGKWRAAPRYPAPRFDTIIEPFAGAAGYSLRHHARKVILVEKYPVIAGIWRYLIAVSAAEILRIPTVDHIDDLPAWVPQEARWLVAMNLGSAIVAPKKRCSAGYLAQRASGRRFCGWTEAQRARVSAQVASVRHWHIVEGDYSNAPAIEATWFVDPPYQGRAGAHYIHGSRRLDYEHLGSWVRSRSGQVVACEAAGAAWLPFVDLAIVKTMHGSHAEAVWLSDEAQLPLPIAATPWPSTIGTIS